MCGIAGEIRSTGRHRTWRPSSGCSPPWPPAARTARACGSSGPVALGAPPAAASSTSPTPAPSRWSTPSCGLAVVFNGCIYNYRELRDELQGAGYRFFSTSDTEVIAQGVPPVGRRPASSASSACSRSRSSSSDTGRLVLARDRLGIKPLYLRRDAGPAAVRLDPAGAAGRRRRRHLDRPGRAAPLHDFHSVVPAPRTILAGVRKLPPATVRVDRAATAREHRPRLLAAGVHPRRPSTRAGRRRLAGRLMLDDAADAPSSGGWSPTCRSACCSPAASTPA